MIVYGVALLAFCTLLGGYLGDILGVAIGVQANVGGVGIAMMFLIIMSNISNKKFHLSPMSESGIKFWSAMYIPIIVAMAAKQNMVVALSSGWMAVVAGVLAVIVGFLMVPVLSKIGNGKKPHAGDKS
jgi:malonate transporter MadL subunit